MDFKFAADAAVRGASAVLWEPRADVAPPMLPPGVFGAAIPNLKSLVGRIADRFFNWPSSQLRITGITGTNGKTTCAYLLAQCLERLGLAAAYMGTIGWGRPAALAELNATTPDAVTVHRTLAQLRSSGVREDRDGGVLACTGPGPRGWRAFSRCGIHQSDARSPGLSRQHAGVRRRKSQAVSSGRPQAHRAQYRR